MASDPPNSHPQPRRTALGLTDVELMGDPPIMGAEADQDGDAVIADWLNWLNRSGTAITYEA